FVQDVTAEREVAARLREVDEQRRAALDAAGMGVWAYDPATDLLTVDERCAAFFGFEGAHARPIGEFVDRISPLDRPQVAAEIARALDPAFGGAYDIEYRIVPPGLAERWVRAKGQTIFSNDDEAPAASFVGVVHDITQRQEAMRALRLSEERYRALVEATAVSVWRTSPEGLIEEPLPEWQGFTGQSFAEARGYGWLDAVHTEDREGAGKAWVEAVSSRRVYETSYRLRRHDGEYRWCVARGVPILREDGSIREWVGTTTDVHEQRQAEAAAREQAVLLRAVLDVLPVGVFVADEAGRLTHVNGAGEAVFGGYRAAEDKSDYGEYRGWRPDGTALKAEDWAMHRALTSGEVVPAEVINIESFDGRWKTILNSAAPIHDEDGRVRGGVATAQDITRLRQVEDELRRLALDLEDRVRERTRELSERSEELEHRNAEQETFLYTASHDLKAPLVSIRGMTELLTESLSRGDGEEARFALSRIERNAGRMTALLNDLLSYARVGRVHEQSVALDLGAVAEAVLADLTLLPARAGVTLDLPARWPTVCYPATEVTQLLTNLLSNAFKYSRSSGREARVRLSWSSEGGVVTLRVEDSGPGVPGRYRERVFRLFERLDAAGEGTGVGLAIVKRIVERHGGKVWIEDSELGGACFSVTLPAAS
ncbi:MAG TPA: PAS domain S-box protein, partial [Deinococcales bacterium]|nr:PAS domain S-box protein [Deinococcales bacterium]